MPDAPQTHERVTRLEAYRETDNLAIQQLSRKIDATHELVQEVKEQLDRQKGFIAGAMFVILPLWSGATIFIQSWMDKFSGSGS